MGISKRLYVGAVVLLAGCGETGGDTGMDPSSDPAVTATVEVSPKTATLSALGDTTRFTAAAKTADGTTIPGKAITWTSSNTQVATVERGAGLVTAVDNGTAAIQATADAIQGSASVTVSQVPASVGVTPSADTLVSVGQTEQLTALALDANDNPIPGIAFSWSSSDETVATVDSAGVVTAVDNGSVTISATTANVVGTADVHVDQALGTIAVEPDEITLDSIGGTAQLTAHARDANGHTIPGTTFVWSSADPDVAMVTPGGLVTAVGNGTTTVRASAGSLSASATVIVDQPDLIRITIRTTGTQIDPDGYSWELGIWHRTPDFFELRPVAGRNGVPPDDVSTVEVIPGNFFLELKDLAPNCVALGGQVVEIVVDAGTVDAGFEIECFEPVQWTAVSAGRDAACGLTRSGRIACWGENDLGQLGSLGSNMNRPRYVTSSLTFQQVSVGWVHACAVDSQGSAHCWGHNGSGRLGDGTENPRGTPTPVAGGLDFRSIEAGFTHTCGVTPGDSLYCWGRNNWGQLGLGSFTGSLLPALVATGVSSVTLGNEHTCAIFIPNDLYCWGSHELGQLGIGGTISPLRREMETSPTFVRSEIAQVDAGLDHTCAITRSGETVCAGLNDYDQLGRAASRCEFTIPCGGSLGLAAVAAQLTRLSSGSGHACGIADETAWCWGSNLRGQLGIPPVGAAPTHREAVTVVGGFRWTMVTAGVGGHVEPIFTPIGGYAAYTCGVTLDGEAYCWGGNADGNLGDGSWARFAPTLGGGLSFNQEFHVPRPVRVPTEPN